MDQAPSDSDRDERARPSPLDYARPAQPSTRGFLWAVAGLACLAVSVEVLLGPMQPLPTRRERLIFAGAIVGALVSGIMAMRAGRSNVHRVMGCVVCIVGALGAAFAIHVFFGPSHDELRMRHRCASRMGGISAALEVYLARHGGAMPQTLDELMAAFRREELSCPAAQGQPSGLYIYYGDANPADPNAIVVSESAANHAGRGAHVLCADGSVRFVDRDTLRRMLKDAQAKP